MRWYVDCFRKFAVFSGRAHRREYWMFTLVNTAVMFALMLVEAGIRSVGAGVDADADGAPVIAGVYSLLVFIPALAVTIRRMHDTDHRGWWMFVPLLNFVFLCQEGDRAANRFGADPQSQAVGFHGQAWKAVSA